MVYPVDLIEFTKSLQTRWGGLGNVTNAALEDAWKSMAQAFNDHIEGKRKNWSVLQLPTGTGKTQGLAVYCAELAKLKKHCGVLIVTRFTAEADNLCNLINQLSGSRQAVARHSKIKIDDEEVNNAPVLIVTHKAYLDAIEGFDLLWDQFDTVLDENKSWDEIARWKAGKRKLTVIDETLNSVELISVTLDEINLLRGFITSRAEKTFAQEVAVFDRVINTFLLQKDDAEGKIIHAIDWREIIEDVDIKRLVAVVNTGNLVGN